MSRYEKVLALGGREKEVFNRRLRHGNEKKYALIFQSVKVLKMLKCLALGKRSLHTAMHWATTSAISRRSNRTDSYGCRMWSRAFSYWENYEALAKDSKRGSASVDVKSQSSSGKEHRKEKNALTNSQSERRKPKRETHKVPLLSARAARAIGIPGIEWRTAKKSANVVSTHKPLSSDELRGRTPSQTKIDDYHFKKRRLTNAGKVTDTSAVDKMYAEDRVTEHVRGFLEVNPFVCTGCGSPFQAKAEGEPGYLPKDMLSEHLLAAKAIKERQEAVRTVAATGLALDSDAAAELLTSAGASEEVIRSVQEMGRKSRSRVKVNRDAEDVNTHGELAEQLSQQQTDGRSSSNIIATPADDTAGTGYTRYQFIAEDPFEPAAQPASGAPLPIDEEDEPTDNEDDIIDDDDLEFDREEEEEGDRSASSKETEFTDVGAAGAVRLFEDLQRHGVDALLSKPYTAARSTYKAAEKLESLSPEEAHSATSSHLQHLKVCQRCHRLHEYGQVDEALRPGFSTNKLLSAEHFKRLLGVIRETSCVVVCVVDVFDLEGSIPKDLKHIAGKNPLLIAANKFDLIPKDVSQVRLTNWIQEEVKFHCGLKSPREIDQQRHAEAKQDGWVRHRSVHDESGILRRQNIHLVSCTTGQGMKGLMESALAIAKDNGKKIFVMGHANVGKSSLINRILETSYVPEDQNKGRRKQVRSDIPLATVSNLPGTTLNFLKIHIPVHDGVTLYDTPGLLNAGQLTNKLTPDELRKVIPVTPLAPVTFRVQQGKSVLLGGLAQVELLEVRTVQKISYI